MSATIVLSLLVMLAWIFVVAGPMMHWVMFNQWRWWGWWRDR
jgi:hypothetical protein